MFKKAVMTLGIGITLLFLVADSFGSYDSTLKYLGVNSAFFLIIYLLVAIFLALFGKYYFPVDLIKYNKKYVTIPLTLLSFAFVLINFLTYSTFILGHLDIQVENFILIAILSGSITFINHSKNQTLYQKLVYFLGPLLLIGFIFIDYFSHPFFEYLNIEDGWVENTQFIFYLGAGLINGYAAFKFLKKKQWVNFVIFAGLSFILIFVAGEEISWGQRIFGIATPEVIKEGNMQGEITLHNESFVQKYIQFFYMGLGLFFSLSGVILLKFYSKVQEKYHILVPSTLTFFYFFSIFVYYYLNQYLVFYYEIFSSERIGLGRWQEVAELLLASGFLIFAVSVFKKVRRETTFLNKPNLEENPIV